MKFLALTLSLTLAACGGGQSNTVDNIIRIPDTQIISTQATFGRVQLYQTAKASHYSEEFTFNIKFNDYFKNNPNGHFAVVTRADATAASAMVLGIGAVFGNVSGATNPNPNDPRTEPIRISPSTQIETWFNGYNSGNYLLASQNPPPVLQDNVWYNVTIRSTTTKKVQLTIKTNSVIMYDTGELDNLNPVFNDKLNDIYVGYVFSDNLASWSVDISDAKLIIN